MKTCINMKIILITIRKMQLIMIGKIIFVEIIIHIQMPILNYGFQPTFNSTKSFENSYEDQPYSTHSSFIPQNTSPYSTSSDFYSTPHCDQVDNTLLEFIREMQEESKISRKRIEENWAFLEEMKLEMENFRSEQEMEVLKNNSKFHGKEGKLSTLPIEISQTSKPSFPLPSLSEKQYEINAIHRVILGEELMQHRVRVRSNTVILGVN